MLAYFHTGNLGWSSAGPAFLDRVETIDTAGAAFIGARWRWGGVVLVAAFTAYAIVGEFSDEGGVVAEGAVEEELSAGEGGGG